MGVATPIEWTYVGTNINNAYNSDTHSFTANKTGLYLHSISAAADQGSYTKMIQTYLLLAFLLLLILFLESPNNIILVEPKAGII